MLKIAIYCVALAASLGASVAVGQAREINVWNHPFTVEDGPAIIAPAPRFNAVVAQPDRADGDRQRLPDADQPR